VATRAGVACGLHVGDLEVVLDPVLVGDLLGVDVGRVGREVVQDHPEALGDRRVESSLSRLQLA
jgi:hypothetical protein